MALWMEAGSEPTTAGEIADLDGISALKQASALELKEEGNNYVKQGKKHYADAINCYTRAINQKALCDSDQSVLLANRAHVNLLLGNYRRALQDSQDAVKLCPSNIKAYYRGAKASLSLNLLDEAKLYCHDGLEKDPSNEELKKLATKIDAQLSERLKHNAEVSNAAALAKDLVSAISERNIKIGKAIYQELTGLRKPVLDRNKILHWPVFLLYAEAMSSDFVEDFCETDTFSIHLDMIFSEASPPLSWDKDNNYTRDSVEVYYEVGPISPLSKSKVLKYLLEGTAAANIEIHDFESGDSDDVMSTGEVGRSSTKWVKVDERRSLYDVLKEPDMIIPGIPVFYVVSKTSSFFYQVFKSGNWKVDWRTT